MTTALGRRLTIAHRQAQLEIGRQTVNQLHGVWPLLDVERLDATTERWITAASSIIDQQRAASSQLAGAYMRAFRQTELGGTAPLALLAGPAPADAVATSLLVTGPVSIKSALSRGVLIARAIDVAEASSSAAGMRHALDGGRDTVTATSVADQRARGWSRQTSGNACQFCEMLAGRGAVYTEATSDFQSHDGCSCTAEPVYGN